MLYIVINRFLFLLGTMTEDPTPVMTRTAPEKKAPIKMRWPALDNKKAEEVEKDAFVVDEEESYSDDEEDCMVEDEEDADTVDPDWIPL